MLTTSILWRRLDAPGHDACRLVRSASGWRLDGTAIFLHEKGSALLGYRLECDLAWRAAQGEVRGWIGSDSVEFGIERMEGGRWTLNGEIVPEVESCIDLDFGFTPATNLLPIRRLSLGEGEAASAPAALLNVTTGTLELLPQCYERLSGEIYRYEAPTAGYFALLDVATSGFIRLYPGLWEEEKGTS